MEDCMEKDYIEKAKILVEAYPSLSNLTAKSL